MLLDFALPQARIETGPSGFPSVERLIDRGQLDQAWDGLQQRVAAQGETARLLLLQGLVRYRQGRFEEALPYLNRSFAQNERDPDTSKALGLCLVKLGREDLAETFFAIAAKLAPRDASAHYYLGLNAYTRRRFDHAIQAFERCAAIQPGSVECRSFLGRGFEAKGRIEDAGRQYQEAVALNRAAPKPSGDPPLLLGTMLYRQERLDEAEQHLREALEYRPESGLARYWLGLLLERRLEIQSAIDQLRLAAELAPKDHRPHYALARLFRRAGEARLAAEAVRRFRELRARSESETFRRD